MQDIWCKHLPGKHSKLAVCNDVSPNSGKRCFMEQLLLWQAVPQHAPSPRAARSLAPCWVIASGPRQEKMTTYCISHAASCSTRAFPGTFPPNVDLRWPESVRADKVTAQDAVSVGRPPAREASLCPVSFLFYFWWFPKSDWISGLVAITGPNGISWNVDFPSSFPACEWNHRFPIRVDCRHEPKHNIFINF